MVGSAIITAGLGTSLVGVLGYAYGYVLRPSGFRPLQILALCFALIALAQLTMALSNPVRDRYSLDYGAVFLILSVAAQALLAVKGRRPQTGMSPAAGDAQEQR
jgi:hypothetical protein